jgi:hypothetical protein
MKAREGHGQPVTLDDLGVVTGLHIGTVDHEASVRRLALESPGVVATHARRHLIDDDDKMARRPQHARRPAQPTKGSEVLRIVGNHGSISFAGTGYRVGNPHRGQTVGICLVGDTVQISIDGTLLRTHRSRHDKTKEFGALAQPHGKPRRVRL